DRAHTYGCHAATATAPNEAMGNGVPVSNIRLGVPESGRQYANQHQLPGCAGYQVHFGSIGNGMARAVRLQAGFHHNDGALRSLAGRDSTSFWKLSRCNSETLF